MNEAKQSVQGRAENPRAEATRNGQFFTPRVDIFETEDALVVLADLPGVAAGDIDLRYENGELTLRGKIAREEARGHAVFSEFEKGDFERIFQVHETIDAARIEAEHKNGVLTVRLPKQEAVKPKQVSIKAQG